MCSEQALVLWTKGPGCVFSNWASFMDETSHFIDDSEWRKFLEVVACLEHRTDCSDWLYPTLCMAPRAVTLSSRSPAELRRPSVRRFAAMAARSASAAELGVPAAQRRRTQEERKEDREWPSVRFLTTVQRETEVGQTSLLALKELYDTTYRPLGI